MKSTSFVTAKACFAVAAVALLSACSEGNPAQRPAPPPPQVTSLEVQARPVPLTYRYAGRVSAFREVEVRARVPGILLERAYVEGAAVKAGDILFRIDPAAYEAELARAKAQLLEAQAQVGRTERDAERAAELFRRQVGTEKNRDDTAAAFALAKATLAGAEAQVRTAEINLGYTTVRAPVDGVTSSRVLPEGSLVGTASDNSLLTRISQLDPVYVNFSFTDSEAAELRRMLDNGEAQRPTDGKLRARVSFGDGESYSEDGYIDFTDSSIDLQTGTIRARAVVPNPGHRLRPGQFVRVAVDGVTLNEAIVIPQTAVMQGPQGPFVYALSADDKAEVRPVKLGREGSEGWVVKSGLKSGDRIVSVGVIKVQPGMKVNVAMADAASQTTTQQ